MSSRKIDIIDSLNRYYIIWK